jgi:hypothetical protein
MNKKEILKELEEKFEKEKERLKFKSSFNEIEEIFLIQDHVLKDGFVSERFSRQLCDCIGEYFLNWQSYLHSLILPNTSNLLNLNESRMISESDKKELLVLMSKIMELVDKNSLVGFTRDESLEREFIDESLDFWKQDFKPFLINVIEKLIKEWEKKEESGDVKPKGYI